LAAAKLMKGKLPLVLIENTYSYADWVPKLKKKADDYINEIAAFGVDVVVFDHWYDVCIPLKLFILLTTTKHIIMI